MRPRALVVRAALLFAGPIGCSSTITGDHPGDGATVPPPDAAADAPPSTATCATGSNTTPAGGAQLVLDLDLAAGPLQQQFTGSPVQVASPLPIAETIYGINNYPEYNYLLNYPHMQWGLMRFGGDSYSAWNWMTNAENNGADNDFENTNQWLPYAYGNTPSDPAYHGDPHDTNMAGGILDGYDSVPALQSRAIASLVTVSLSDYVAANANDATVTYAPSSDFVASGPNAASGAAVQQDGFVRLVTSSYHAAPVFFSLDNEPNYWRSTHPEVFGANDLSFDALVARDTTYATMVKSIAPDALVFGPVIANVDGMTWLDDFDDLKASNPYATSGIDATVYYLSHMAAASTAAGARLLDVLDLHYYNTAVGKSQTPKTDDQCAQGPRDYWDPSYTTPDDEYDDYIPGWNPRVMIPRMSSEIAANFAGTRLAFSEYNNGCETTIGGGIAEADTLGVFGQYGVFAATAWPLSPTTPGTNELVAGFAAYRDYDGNGSTVGALAIAATTPDASKVSVYGFTHPGAAGVEVVAINKTDAAITTEIRLSNACSVSTATAYQLTSSTNASMAIAGSPLTVIENAIPYTLPAMSVTTLVFR